MSEETVHFSSPGECEEVLPRGSGLLSALEKAFSIRCTSRDNWIQFRDGTEEQLQEALRFLDLLRKARSVGLDLRGPTRFYFLEQFLEGKEAELERLLELRIDVMTGKKPVFPKTLGQARYLRSIRRHDITFGLGPAGTGKTYLAMASAVSALLRGDVDRILLTRPAVEAGEALGFLPGDLQQKILPYLRPLYDALHDMLDAATLEAFTEKGVIEVAPLAYMRGRTLNNSYVLLDEAQNTTEEQMLMFLTRIGYDSTCVVNGDSTQIDLPGNRRSGLKEALRVLRKVEGIGIEELKGEDVVRHALVQRIISAYDQHRAANAT